MKKLFFITAILCAVFCSSCSKEYDDSALWNDLNSLEARVAKLEELCKQMNTNISSLQTIVSALQSNDYVTGVTPITKDGEIIGYTITFKKSQPITIYHGEDGKDGKDGQNGKDGKDGQTPNIGVKKDVDGIYYWTLNGEWLLDDNGNKIKAQGIDGKDGVNGTNGDDGTNGQDGVDGITPQLKIENDYWYISYDNGKSWEKLGKATGEDGVNGTNGEDGDSMFTNIDTTSSDEYVIFTLSDGTQIKLPTWSAFEALRTQCNQMNTNIESLQALINVLQSHDYIKSVTPLMENGIQVGYTITFAYANAITIYSNATNPTAPIIGVKKDADGIYYWTLNGEWLLDDAGNKIKAEGADGSDGTNGSNGTDGITPKLKIEEGYWYVSYDNGTSWTKLGKATGADGSNGLDAYNIVVTQDNDYVYFELSDGTIISIYKTYPLTGEDFIDFDDVTVKSVCLKYWDTNHDGELSYNEAAVVETLNGYFSKNTTIRLFNELQYFTSLSKIGMTDFNGCSNLCHIKLPANISAIDGEQMTGAFSNCTSLTSIVIPQSVEYIGSAVFYGCTSLQNVIFEEGCKLTKIDGGVYTSDTSSFYSYKVPGAFYNCTSLKTIIIPANVEIIEEGTFANCTSLESVIFEPNSKLKEIQGAASAGSSYSSKYYAGTFYNCKSLKSIIIPASVESIGLLAFGNCAMLESIIFENDSKLKTIDGKYYKSDSASSSSYYFGAFNDCTALTTLTIPANTENINGGAFAGCTLLKSVTFETASRIKYIGNEAFYGTSFTTIEIPASIEEIRANAFYSTKIESFYIKALTPPIVSTATGRNICGNPSRVYVPRAVVEDYKTISGWKNYADRIVGYDFE
ncbi:MAG: leucine-rich repeat protein [Alistipes sp.]|nr:leucine-rich repeat protein [Alistipes sp.]